MIDLSIVVVTWETRDLVLECLAALEDAMPASGLECEVIVVDNGSTDGTAQAVRSLFPRARLLVQPRNRGFAAGCNAALRERCGRHVLLLNSDTRVLPGALERCLRFLDAHPDVGVVGPQLLNPDGTTQNSIHNSPLVVTELLPKGLFQFLFRRRFPSRRWASEGPLEVEAVSGAALFARGAAIERVGPLSEEYFFFLEETDWCWRVREAGWRVVHLPDARVVHLSGGSSKRRNPALTRIEYHRSLYRFFRKYRGVSSAAVVFALRFSKAFFYVVSQAPVALAGGRGLARWRVHRDVFAWHLRGCPTAVGLGQLSTPGAAPPRASAARSPTDRAGEPRLPAGDARV